MASDQNGASYYPALSGDGQFVAYTSNSGNLVTGDTNGTEDVFIRDRHAGTTERVSVSSNGLQGNDASSRPSISSDGRFVAFTSSARNLVPEDDNGKPDVFVRDRRLGTTERVTLNGNGVEADDGSSSAAINADGRYVAFLSLAKNLVSGDTNDQVDVFVRDRKLALTERVNVDGNGAQVSGQTHDIAISGDGRLVAFASSATNLVPGDTNNILDVFLRDLEHGTTTRVSIANSGAQADDGSITPSLSENGRYVAFFSDAKNLVAADNNHRTDLFVRDRELGVTERVSVGDAGEEPDNFSLCPSISGDGRFVAFYSFAKNLVIGDTNDMQDIFVRDRQQRRTVRVNVDSTGAQVMGSSYNTTISRDGRFVGFDSDVPALVPGDTDQDFDTFVVPNPLAAADTAPPRISTLGAGSLGASNGLPYLRVQVTDAAGGMLKVQLTSHSRNCHLEYPLGLRVAQVGAPLPQTLETGAANPAILYVVKDNDASIRVELQAWDAANNSKLTELTIASSENRNSKRVARARTNGTVRQGSNLKGLQRDGPHHTGARLR